MLRFSNYTSKLIWFCFFILIASFFVNTSFSYLDYDLGWHLHVGKEIVNEKAVPSTNTDLEIIGPVSWVDHEWLLNALVYLVYDKFGYIFLTLVFAFFFVLMIGLLAFFVYKFHFKKFLSNKEKSLLPASQRGLLLFFSISLFGVYAMSPFIGIRFQLFGNLFFLLLLILLEYGRKNSKGIFYLIPLFVIWANTHGSFLLGLGIIWVWLFFRFIEPILKKSFLTRYFSFQILEKNKRIRLALATLMASFATLFNPYGFGLYSFLHDYKNTFYMGIIVEWRSFFEMPIIYSQFFYIAISVSIFLMILVNFFVFRKSVDHKTKTGKLDPWLVFLCLFFFLMALKSKRHFPLFFISTLPLIFQFLYFEFLQITKFISYEKSKKILLVFSSFLFLALSFFLISKTNFNNEPFTSAYCHNQPCAVFEFIQNNPKYYDLKVLNEYSWGGYFLWRAPERKIFIDGRMPQFSTNERSMLEEYKDFFNPDTAQKQLEKYGTELIILKKEKYLNLKKWEEKLLGIDEEEANPEDIFISEFLDKNDAWQKIYEDSMSMVYIKNDL